MKKQNSAEKVILSISLLVSNRKKYIRKTMESLKPLLEQVPCELIVVDTVGEEHSDGSLAIAKEYADKVIYFPWCNDFAAARNAGLKETSGEWFLYLDDDEWFEDVTEFIRFFQSGEYKEYDRGWYIQRNYSDFAGNSYHDAYVDRMCRLDKGIGFYGIIHECLLPLGNQVKKFSVYVHHYGYAYENEEARIQHSNRNISLLKKYLEDTPDDIRMTGQLVQEYVSTGRFDDALVLCHTGIRNAGEWTEDVFVQYLLVMLFRIEVYRKNWAEAEAVFEEVKACYPLGILSEFVCLTEFIKVKEKLQKFPEVLSLCKEYFAKKCQLSTEEDIWTEQAVFDFLSYLSEEKEKEVVEKGIYATAMTGNCELAKYLLDKVNWSDEVNRPFGPMCWLVELYEKTGREDLFLPYADRIMKNKKMVTQFSIMVNNLQRKLQPTTGIKLSIGILVSNRIQYIRKMLDALKPLLEVVPSELVIIDTTGMETSPSMEIAREYTDKIYPFTWCNDFAAARNFCLNHTQGEWFMFQDDDEWFEDVSELIEFFRSGECEKYNSGYYKVKSYDEYGNFTMAVAGRMIRRTKDTCFVGKIHETFSLAPGPHKYFDCYVHHMGYAFSSAEAKKTHQKRNTSILLKELEEEGYSPKNCAQMVQELLTMEETLSEGLAFAEKSLQELQKQNVMEDSCSQWVLTATVKCYAIMKEYVKLLEQAKKVRSSYNRSRVAELVISAIVVQCAFSEKDYATVLENVKSYIEQWDWLQTHEKEANLLMQLDFPSYCTEEYYFSILHAGAMASNHQRDYQLAMEYWNRFPWKRPGFDAKKYVADMQVTKEGLKTGTPKLIKSDIKLTIGMLVSNHVQYIRNAMEALKPLLEAIPSELVVLDTKGADTDGSIEIVKEYTDKVYPFTWCNDFSAARNACLEHARGEWFLYQDDDEWFDDVQEFIDFFQSGECEKYHTGFYYTKDYDATGGSSMAVAGRMIRRTERTRFVGKVHETFNEVFAPNKQFNCFTHHMGYVFSTPESRKQHQIRNVSILEEEIKENGYTPRICAQMAQELLYVAETAEQGLEFANKSVAELKKQGLMGDSCSQWLLTSLMRYYSVYGTYEQLKEQTEAIRKEHRVSQMAQLVMAGVAVREAGEHGDMDYLLENVNCYIENWDWLQLHPEEALVQTQLDFPRYYRKEYYYDVLRSGALVENHRGNYENAKDYWDRFPWGEEGFDGSQYMADVQITYIALKEARKRKQQEEAAWEEIRGLYAVLFEAEPVVTQYLRENRNEGVLELLSGMQEVVITIGNKMEKLIGEGTELIHELEDCCEKIWQCANTDSTEEASEKFEEIMTFLREKYKAME